MRCGRNGRASVGQPRSASSRSRSWVRLVKLLDSRSDAQPQRPRTIGVRERSGPGQAGLERPGRGGRRRDGRPRLGDPVVERRPDEPQRDVEASRRTQRTSRSPGSAAARTAPTSAPTASTDLGGTGPPRRSGGPGCPATDRLWAPSSRRRSWTRSPAPRPRGRRARISWARSRRASRRPRRSCPRAACTSRRSARSRRAGAAASGRAARCGPGAGRRRRRTGP